MPGTRELRQSDPSLSLERELITNIDLAPLFGTSESERAELIARVRKACLETGFFYVHNSCVPESVIQAALAASREFFSFRDDHPVKQAVHNRKAGGMKGWGPMFGEPSYQENTVAHVESFDLGQQLSVAQYRQMNIDPNIWPELKGFREAILAYYQACTRLGQALSGVFSELLGEDRDFIVERSQEQAPRTMRLLHYPKNEAPADARHVGIAAHTDFECFTIMNQTAGGLELTGIDGNWYQAPSDIGTFTVILGDMMERFSNGHFKATGHRVANTPWTRYSMVLFFAVNGDYPVSPLPRFIRPDRPDQYGVISQDEHIQNELARAANHHSTTMDSM
jgi:isopenicillin N synthase-like dioxygenase